MRLSGHLVANWPWNAIQYVLVMHLHPRIIPCLKQGIWGGEPLKKIKICHIDVDLDQPAGSRSSTVEWSGPPHQSNPTKTTIIQASSEPSKLPIHKPKQL